MIDPETQKSPAQLPLPAGFLEPGPTSRAAAAEPTPATKAPAPPVDTTIDELIGQFRRVAARQAAAATQAPWLTRLLESLRRERGTATTSNPAAPEAVWPRVSLILPLLNPALSCTAALDAVFAQAYPDLELIILTPEAGLSLPQSPTTPAPRIVLLDVPATADIPEALRKGFARASGEVLAWLEPGTILLPGILRRVGSHFREPRATAVLAMEVIADLAGWRFAAEPAFDPAALFVSRLAYDIADGLADVAAGTANPPHIAAALAARLAPTHGLTRLAVHAAVVRRDKVTNAEAETGPGDAAAPISALASAATPAFWFAPETIDAVPAQDGTAPVAPPPCPIHGSAPERFLFASPDTRFGGPGLCDIWYHAGSRATATAPAIGRAEVRRLAAQQPSLAERRIIDPEPDAPSPWRDWRFGAKLLALAQDHPLPGWLLDRWPLKRAITWTDRTGDEIEAIIKGLLPRTAKGIPAALRALEVGCHAGDILDYLQRRGWKTHGTELNVAAAEAARAKGHTIWAGAPDDILQTVPVEERFDLVFLGHVVERQADPLALVQRAARLLRPEGLLVIATPNLDSAQIDLFGPTWAHWHPPYHRVVLSRRALGQIAAASGLRLRRCRSWSHPYWSWLSHRLNRAGLAGVVPNGVVPDGETRSAVETLILASRLLHDWRGRGDYLYAALSPDTRF